MCWRLAAACSVKECNPWSAELIHLFICFLGNSYITGLLSDLEKALQVFWSQLCFICCVHSPFVCIIVFLQIRGPSKRKHVHGCSLVRAKNLYGYHASEELFMKIYLYPQFIHFHKSNCLQMCQHHLLYPSLFSVKGICWKVWICLSHSFLSNQLTAETAKLELIFGHLLQLLNCNKCRLDHKMVSHKSYIADVILRWCDCSLMEQCFDYKNIVMQLTSLILSLDIILVRFLELRPFYW